MSASSPPHWSVASGPTVDASVASLRRSLPPQTGSAAGVRTPHPKSRSGHAHNGAHPLGLCAQILLPEDAADGRRRLVLVHVQMALPKMSVLRVPLPPGEVR